MSDDDFNLQPLISEFKDLKKRRYRNDRVFNPNAKYLLSEAERAFEILEDIQSPIHYIAAFETFVSSITECSNFIQNDLQKFLFPLFIHLASRILSKGSEFYFSSFLNKHIIIFTQEQRDIISTLQNDSYNFQIPIFEIDISELANAQLQNILENDKLIFLSLLITQFIKYNIRNESVKQNDEILSESARLAKEESLIKKNFEIFNPGMLYVSNNNASMDFIADDHNFVHDIHHLTVFNHHDKLSCVKISPCGRLFGYAESTSVRLFILDEPKKTHFPNGTATTILNKHSKKITNFEFSRNSAMVVSGGMDNEIRIAHTEASQQLAHFKYHSLPISCVNFLSDTFYALGGGFDGLVTLWTMQNVLPVREFIGHSGAIMGISAHQNDKITTIGYDKTVRTFDVGSGNEIYRIILNENPLCLDTDLNSELIAVGMNSSVCVYSSTGELKTKIPVENRVTDVKFTRNCSEFVFSCIDGKVSIWDVNGNQIVSVKPDSATSDSIQILDNDSLAICGKSYKC